MDMRPQAATSSGPPGSSRPSFGRTGVRRSIPWTNAAISGFILGPGPARDRQVQGKPSRPKTPSRRAIRRRVLLGGGGRLGTDAAYDIGQMKVGRRLAIKLLNATKFALGWGEVAATSPTRSPSRSISPCSPACATSWTEPPWASRGVGLPHPAWRSPELLDLLRRLPELVKGPGVWRPGRGSCGERGAAAGTRCAAAPAGADPALCHRRGLVVVARRLDPPRLLADGRGVARGRRPLAARRRQIGPRLAVRRRSPRPESACGPDHLVTFTGPRRPSTGSVPPRLICALPDASPSTRRMPSRHPSVPPASPSSRSAHPLIPTSALTAGKSSRPRNSSVCLRDSSVANPMRPPGRHSTGERTN